MIAGENKMAIQQESMVGSMMVHNITGTVVKVTAMDYENDSVYFEHVSYTGNDANLAPYNNPNVPHNLPTEDFFTFFSYMKLPINNQL